MQDDELIHETEATEETPRSLEELRPVINDQPYPEAELSETVQGDVPPPYEPTPEAAPGPEVEVQQVEQPTIHILVQRDPETGNIEVDVVATGDVRPTEIESLIKLGLNKWRTKINLPG